MKHSRSSRIDLSCCSSTKLMAVRFRPLYNRNLKDRPHVARPEGAFFLLLSARSSGFHFIPLPQTCTLPRKKTSSQTVSLAPPSSFTGCVLGLLVGTRTSLRSHLLHASPHSCLAICICYLGAISSPRASLCNFLNLFILKLRRRCG